MLTDFVTLKQTQPIATPFEHEFRVTARPRRVLVVEDNLDSVRTLAALVKEMGHHVAYAINGYAALEIGRRHRPQVVLLDLGLPGMDGYELCRSIRADPAFSGARLIALTAYGNEEHRARSRAAGCELHLVKPVAERALFEALESR